MEKLPESFRKNSYDFKLVSREGDVAIYELREPSDGRFVCYEIFIVKKHEERIFPDGKVTSAREATPSNEQWGTEGFTCHSLEAAKEKMVLLQQKLSDRAAGISVFGGKKPKKLPE